MKAKIFTLTGIVSLICATAFAQVRDEAGNSFNKYSVGVSAGYTTLYGSLDKRDPEAAFALHITRHFNPYVCADLEVINGMMKNEETPNHWTTGLSETSQFTTVNLKARVSAGEIIRIPRNTFEQIATGIYVGAGAGVLDNNVTNIIDKFKTTDTKTIDDQIVKNGYALQIPLEIGINYYVKNLFDICPGMINLNYQADIPFNDNADGYVFSTKNARRKFNAMYTVLSVGVSFYLGRKD